MFVMKMHDLKENTPFENKTPDSYNVVFQLFCKAEPIFRQISTKLCTLSANVQPLFMLPVSYLLFSRKAALFFTVFSFTYAILIPKVCMPLKVWCLLVGRTGQ